MSRENYRKKLEFCIHKQFSDKVDSYYWNIAAQVYEHLIDCPLTHATDKDGNPPTCEWSANGVEK
jgi:hypothetical protein